MTGEELNTLPVHSGWAFVGDAAHCANENAETYSELEAVCCFGDAQNGDWVVIQYAGAGYAHTNYQVVSNPTGLDSAHIALFCDRGNLCFGYGAMGGTITINTG